GIMRKTARRAIQNLAAMGHVVCAGNKIESLKVTDLKITDQYLTYEGRDDSEAEDEPPLAAALRQLGIRDPEAIIEQGEATGLLGSDLIDFCKRLHKKHDAGKWGPDPSRLILAA